ncbi:MAG: THUMP-like domain-containing protein [Anaerolineae bacterium]
MVPLSMASVEFLLGDRALATLASLAEADLSDANILPLVEKLRQQFDRTEAAVLLDQARLRRKARRKFPHPEGLFFTDDALQQASTQACARYRAQAYRGYRRVADLGCGIGADTLALARVVPDVVAVERDPVRARLAEANVAASGLADRVRVVCGDWTSMSLDVDAAFVDPSRRTEQGQRVFSLDAMQPPISAVLALVERVPNVTVKVAPGVKHQALPAACEVVFLSEQGRLKEADLLFGGLRTGARRQAVLLPAAHRLDSEMPVGLVPVHEPEVFLYEPDPAVLRAGLVKTLASQMGAAQIDPTIAYLTSPTLIDTPFARSWRILRHGHFNLKELNHWLKENQVSHVTIKKRGSPIDPDTFRRRLKVVRGGHAMTVFFSRAAGAPWMILAQEVARPIHANQPEPL